jgi:CPA1 family monovalent cation:H+ antiporter
MEHELLNLLFVAIGVLGVAVASSLTVGLLRLPYTVGMVIVGILIAIAHVHIGSLTPHDVELTPEVILYIILPILIFDAALNIDVKALRRNLLIIIILAVFGLLLSAFVTGIMVAGATPLTIGAALVFGALISATDPVAVIGLFNEIGAPRQLVTIVDGESIFNDATAIVLFTIFMTAIESGVTSVGPLVANGVGGFFVVLLGGLATGAVIGSVGSLVMRIRKGDLILQITMSLIIAYLAFAIADLLDVSGVMSVLSAGIATRILTDGVIKQENNDYIEIFWNYFTFLANSFVFLLLGITEADAFTSAEALLPNLRYLAVAVLAVSVARVGVVYLLVPLVNRFTAKEKVSLAYRHILFWGGLRGAVPVALVLAIPRDFAGRELIVQMTFAYILFTLFIQGTSMKWLMNRLGIKTEKSYFDYHPGEDFTLDMPSQDLAFLVLSQIVTTLENEGFYTVEHEYNGSESAFLMRLKGRYILAERREAAIRITTESGDLAYGKQLLYETLVELDKSVSSLGEVVHPQKMRCLVGAAEKDDSNASLLLRYLDRDAVIIGLKSSSKSDVIRELLDHAVKQKRVQDAEAVYTALLEREKRMSTGLENGVAIPHARINAVDRIVLVLGVKPDGIDFSALDGKPSRIFFMIISPSSASVPHIKLLAEISRLMADSNLRDALLNSPDAATLIDALRRK